MGKSAVHSAPLLLGSRDVTPSRMELGVPLRCMRARTWVFILVGAILIGFASFLFAMTRDPDGWQGLTMRELAVRSLLVGGSVGAILGLLLARVTTPSKGRRLALVALFAMVGAAVGIVLTLAAGEFCSDGVLESFCGLSFLGWNFSFGVAIALSAAMGVLVGVLLGLVAGFGLPHRESAAA